jgi:quercetin dioxygenase-like cupin family protein
MSEPEPRLRPHPADRFAGPSHFFDLSAALAKLRSEAHPAESGHRQVTLFHRAPVAKVLFSFDAGSELADHAANGLVTIHALEGRLQVEAEGHHTLLGPNQIVVLGPGVRHSVRATEPGAMLLTIVMEGQK